MAGTSIKEDLLSQMDDLSPELQRKVLEFAKSMAHKGGKGASLLKFVGSIPPDDLRRMTNAIEEGCEKVDKSEW